VNISIRNRIVIGIVPVQQLNGRYLTNNQLNAE